jgi:hypothetical protein
LNSQIVALLVGPTERVEFHKAVEALRSSSRVVPATDVAAAEAILQDGLAPDLIVVAQAFPGQVTADGIDRLRRLAPLACVLGLLGSWCEGEMRSGRPWPAALRVYWHQWLPRCRRELGELAAGRCTTWTLPSTASDEERFLALAERRPEGRQGLIAIDARQFEMQAWLVDACRHRGYATVWLRPEQPVCVEGAKALIFDFGGEVDAEQERLCGLARLLRPAPVLALVNFPRIQDRERLLAAGVAAILSKPLLVDDLYGELDRLAGGA